MSASSPPPEGGHLQIRRKHPSDGGLGVGGQYDGGPHGVDALSDSLVDQVVERIERRVIEELERRGRRNGRGGF